MVNGPSAHLVKRKAGGVWDVYICVGNNDIYLFRNVLVGLCLVLQVAVYFSQRFRSYGTFRVFT